MKSIMHQYVCPLCKAVGASTYIPLCHRCDYKVFMKPSSNGKIIKNTDRMYKYYEALGHEVPQSTLESLDLKGYRYE